MRRITGLVSGYFEADSVPANAAFWTHSVRREAIVVYASNFGWDHEIPEEIDERDYEWTRLTLEWFVGSEMLR